MTLGLHDFFRAVSRSELLRHFCCCPVNLQDSSDPEIILGRYQYLSSISFALYLRFNAKNLYFINTCTELYKVMY
jgi:hypothetical protein